ncbi:helix-turn-helix transcriptional regulator [Gephyromycinifex aptenodytis]|uniref:helix-turn-helix transcriptional regulator n=1 Tax=Gephyromycinifex aptenodytis TaxID=2716227 RepID=UPI0014474AB2|nr:MarR family transcriptional regulator [Gephyromycinifex aptenodytis]
MTGSTGPRSALSESFARLTALTPAQRTALAALAGRAEAVTASELAAELGVQPSSVRETLEALRETGLVGRERMPTLGRGRPSWGYLAIGPVDVDLPVRMLAQVLDATARVLRASHPDPALAAHQIGREWGGALLAQDVPDHDEHEADSYDELPLADHMGKIAFFSSSLGFSASVNAAQPTSLLLRGCPFVRNGAIDPLLCRMHLGMMERIIEATSRGRVSTSLRPWVSQDVCALDLLELPGYSPR